MNKYSTETHDIITPRKAHFMRITRSKIHTSIVGAVMIVLFGLLIHSILDYKYKKGLSSRFVAEKLTKPAEKKSNIYTKEIKNCEQAVNVEKCIINNFTSNRSLFKAGNVLLIYKDLGHLLDSGKIISYQCHSISHVVGEETFRANGDFMSIFTINIYQSINNTNCSNGYYHGIMIGVSKNTNSNTRLIYKLKNIITNSSKFLEESLKDPARTAYNDFFHGLGHAMFTHTNDQDEALELCENILEGDSYKENLCFTGVFMEMSALFMTAGENLDPNICNGLETKYRNGCYSGIQITKIYSEENYLKIADTCEKEEDWSIRFSCIKSFPLQAIYNDTHPKFVIDFCREFSANTDDQIGCLYYYQKLYPAKSSTYHTASKTIDEFELENSAVRADKLCKSVNILSYPKCLKTMKERVQLVYFEHMTNLDFIKENSFSLKDFPLLLKRF